MSSLLQFDGTINERGVGLQFVKSTIRMQVPFGFDRETLETWTTTKIDYDEKYLCTVCGKLHPRIYVAFRKPVGMFGCWVEFRYNGEVHVPDLSHPITVEKYPRDAIPMSDVESSYTWHRPASDSELRLREFVRMMNLMR